MMITWGGDIYKHFEKIFQKFWSIQTGTSISFRMITEGYECTSAGLTDFLILNCADAQAGHQFSLKIGDKL